MSTSAAALGRQQLPARGLWLLAALVLTWGSHWPIMKLALGEMPVLSFRAITAVLGALGLFAIAWSQGKSLAVPRARWGGLVLAAAFNITGWFFFSALALTLMPASRGTIVAYTMPLFSFLLGMVVLKERPTGSQWLGLLLGLAAVALLIGNDVWLLGETPWGALSMLAAAASFGFGAVVQKHIRWETPVLTVTAWQLAVGGVPLVLAALVLDRGAFDAVTWVSVLALFYTVAFGTVFGITTWLYLVSLLPVQVASLSVLMVPVVGVISSTLVLGESVGWREWGALVLVLVSISRVLPMPRLFSR